VDAGQGAVELFAWARRIRQPFLSSEKRRTATDTYVVRACVRINPPHTSLSSQHRIWCVIHVYIRVHLHCNVRTCVYGRRGRTGVRSMRVLSPNCSTKGTCSAASCAEIYLGKYFYRSIFTWTWFHSRTICFSKSITLTHICICVLRSNRHFFKEKDANLAYKVVLDVRFDNELVNHEFWITKLPAFWSLRN
jgi:hypothetical protein